MPKDIYFPVRSNAQALVMGPPADSVRKRLKFASLLFENVVLQPGIFRMSAGPGGSFAVVADPEESERRRFESARGRGIAAKRGFVVRISSDDPDSAALGSESFISSRESVSWNASLEPFGREFSSDCAWVEWDTARSVETPLRSSTLRSWKRHADGNVRVRSALPERFLRSVVVTSACNDLIDAASVGAAVSMDRAHSAVAGSTHEFGDVRIRPIGFGLPIMLPDVVRMSWEEIADARRHPGLVRLRRELEGIEEVVIQAGGADLNTAVRLEVDRRVRDVALATDSALGAAGRVAVGSLIGFGAGLPFIGLAGLGGAALGSVVGGAIEGGRTALERESARRNRKWIAFIHQFAPSPAAGIK